MVKIKAIRAANAAFKAANTSPVAVFVGATSGIGLETAKALAASTVKPTLYILGRSKKSATPFLNDLAKINAEATVNFIETEVSLIKNVDKATAEIQAKEQKIDLLFMSPGGILLGPRVETAEGIEIGLALRYYIRMRFVNNLLPQLEASASPRVVAILAGGEEADLDMTDLEYKKNYNGMKAANQGATQLTLAFEELAKTHPKISWVHKYPGFVSTGTADKILNSATGVFSIPAKLVKVFLVPVMSKLFAMPQAVAGERALFDATSPAFPAAEPAPEAYPLPAGITVSKSNVVADGKGNGVYCLSPEDELSSAPIMATHRSKENGKGVWAETQAVWERALKA